MCTVQFKPEDREQKSCRCIEYVSPPDLGVLRHDNNTKQISGPEFRGILCQMAIRGWWWVQEHGCGDKQLKRLVRSCGIRPDASPLDRQFLFNVYMHPSSSFKGAPILAKLSNSPSCPLPSHANTALHSSM